MSNVKNTQQIYQVRNGLKNLRIPNSSKLFDGSENIIFGPYGLEAGAGDDTTLFLEPHPQKSEVKVKKAKKTKQPDYKRLLRKGYVSQKNTQIEMQYAQSNGYIFLFTKGCVFITKKYDGSKKDLQNAISLGWVQTKEFNILDYLKDSSIAGFSGLVPLEINTYSGVVVEACEKRFNRWIEINNY